MELYYYSAFERCSYEASHCRGAFHSTLSDTRSSLMTSGRTLTRDDFLSASSGRPTRASASTTASTTHESKSTGCWGRSRLTTGCDGLTGASQRHAKTTSSQPHRGVLQGRPTRASYKGVSINDCIHNARVEVDRVLGTQPTDDGM